MIGGKVVADNYDARRAVGPKLDHLNGVAGIKVKDLIASDDVNRGECFWRQQIIDRRRRISLAAVRARQPTRWNTERCAIGFAVTAAFDGKRHKL
jgi:hypothetical protein